MGLWRFLRLLPQGLIPEVTGVMKVWAKFFWWLAWLIYFL